ncbi:MAG TPA: sulfatase-like hydrolase/transferase [Bryobacteraceae bacterium]|nr:sulfatase-like hydrolase/transferase [Bryobacteraceae bacterium]
MSDSQATASPALAGALSGLKAWTTYWVVESLFFAVSHTLHPPAEQFRQPDPWFADLALPVYMIAGALGGALIAVCANRLIPRRAAASVPLAGPVSLALIFLFHIHAAGGWRVQILIAVTLAAIFVATLLGKVTRETLAPFTNAWCISFALLAYPFAVAEFQGHAIGRWTGALGILAILLISYAMDRLPIRLPARGLLLPCAVVATVIASHAASGQRPIITAAPVPGASAAHGRSNVILITLDTVRADHLSLYGYPRDTTPHLQQFARDATVYTRAIAASDMTLASHASIFTGLYASQHGAHWELGRGKDGVAIGPEFGLRLAANSRTLARILAHKGYRTMGIAANAPYLQHAFQLDQGFQYFSLPVPRIFLDRSCPFCLRADLARVLGRFLAPELSDLTYVRAGEINREAFELLDQEKADSRSFFLFLNYMDAHQPYFPPAPYDLKYPGKDAAMTAEHYWSIEFKALSGSRPYTDRDRARDESQYDGGIAYIDVELGKLFARLKQLGFYDNSIVIVTSDHGQSFGEKGLVGHGSSVYQEQVHVPLIVKYPKVAHADVRNNLVSHVDLLPTILESLGYETGSLPGHSLLAPQSPQTTIFSESFPCDLLVSLNNRFRRIERAAFVGDFKLIAATNGTHQFYDLSADSHEEHNVYADRLPAAGALEAGLHRWESTVPVPRAQPARVDEHAMEILKSLGYLQ